MSFKQCSAFKPDGERCRRVAQNGSDYCHSHRQRIEEKPLPLQPLPEGRIRLVSATAWAICEFCGDAYPLKDLRPDKNNKLACRCCYFGGALLNAAKPIPEGQQKKRYISVYQAEELARRNGISYDAALVELQEIGFKPEEHSGHLFFVKSEASA